MRRPVSYLVGAVSLVGCMIGLALATGEEIRGLGTLYATQLQSSSGDLVLAGSSGSVAMIVSDGLPLELTNGATASAAIIASSVGCSFYQTNEDNQISTDTTAVDVGGGSAAGSTLIYANGFSHDGNLRATYTGATTRWFRVTICTSARITVAGAESSWYVAVDGSIDAASRIDRNHTNNDIGSITTVYYVQLAQDNYVEPWVATSVSKTTEVDHLIMTVEAVN